MHKITVYLHSNKESNLEQAEALGLDDASQYNFKFALYEVEFDLDVHEDGSYDILEIQDGDKRYVPTT